MAFGAFGKIALGWASKVVVKKVMSGLKKLSKKGLEIDEPMVRNYINRHIDLPRLDEAEEDDFIHHVIGILKILYKAIKRGR